MIERSPNRSDSTASRGDDARPPFSYHLKVHSFRLLTVILAWLLIGAAFLEIPELLTGAQRLMQRGLETLGDNVPPPWGPRFEFIFREIGGVVWLQITIFVVLLRVILSTLAMLWRSLRRRRASP
jgi:hypothetical protein